MDKTEYCKLSLWNEADRILMEDFNGDNQKLDAALKAEADARTEAVTALNTAVAGLGNCEIGVLQYTATNKYGSANPTTITFPRKPAAFIIVGPENLMFSICESGYGIVVCNNVAASGTLTFSISCTWTDTKVSFYAANARYQMNSNTGATYRVLAFYQNGQKA